jgi:DNA-binding transcriptional regulator YiaG
MNLSSKKRIQTRKHEVTIPTVNGSAVAERIKIMVPMEWDAELGVWLMTPEAEAMVENTKARHMGLLLPIELLELRQRLTLSQQMIGELLQIGAKTWTRWETGKQRPSRSMNLLLRALHSGLISAQQLLEIGGMRHDWSAQFRVLASGTLAAEPIALDLCRENAKARQQNAPVPFEPMKLPA